MSKVLSCSKELRSRWLFEESLSWLVSLSWLIKILFSNVVSIITWHGNSIFQVIAMRVLVERRKKTRVKRNPSRNLNRIRNLQNPFRAEFRWSSLLVDSPIPDPTNLPERPMPRPDLLRHRNLLQLSIPIRPRRAATAAVVQATKVKLRPNLGRWATKSGKSRTEQRKMATVQRSQKWKWWNVFRQQLKNRPRCRTTVLPLKIVFLINQDGLSPTGDIRRGEDEVIQVCLPRPPRATSSRTLKPNRKQKRKQQQQQQGDFDSQGQQQPFSYSVKYFTWALSDEEDDDDDDDSSDECQNVTLPLSKLKISNSSSNAAKK